MAKPKTIEDRKQTIENFKKGIEHYESLKSKKKQRLDILDAELKKKQKAVDDCKNDIQNYDVKIAGIEEKIREQELAIRELENLKDKDNIFNAFIGTGKSVEEILQLLQSLKSN